MDQERIWEHFQGTAIDTFASAEPRYAAVVRAAVPRMRGRPGRVLNIGAGAGGCERRLLALGWQVATLDVTAVAVERLRALGVDARRGHAESLPFGDESFDVVIASEVLEHIPLPARAQAISEAARVLRPRGWFIGTVPYRENLQDNEAVCPACVHVFHRWGHADSFDKARLVRELSTSFDVRRCRPVAFVDWSRAKTMRGMLKALAKSVLGRMGERAVYPCLFFEAQRS